MEAVRCQAGETATRVSVAVGVGVATNVCNPRVDRGTGDDQDDWRHMLCSTPDVHVVHIICFGAFSSAV